MSGQRPDCVYGYMTQCHKTACTNPPEDENLVVRNMSKTQ